MTLYYVNLNSQSVKYASPCLHCLTVANHEKGDHIAQLTREYLSPRLCPKISVCFWISSGETPMDLLFGKAPSVKNSR